MSPVVTSLAPPATIVAEWIRRLEAALEANDAEATSALFLADGWWRDLLALTWDLRTLRGRAVIADALRERLGVTGLGGWQVADQPTPEFVGSGSGRRWVQAMLAFETAVGRGRGVVRLVLDDDGEWRAWTLLTALRELKGHEERRGERRPRGTDRSSGTWTDLRARQRDFLAHEPRVLVIGAGQGGLSIAARLGQLGIQTLVVEKNDRVGDNWRKRYPSLVLHDPVWANHLPYMAFPDSWPVFTPKDKLADWFEAYESTLELNVWTGTKLLGADYDERAAGWTVRVRRRDGGERVLRPGHLILATGALGEPNVPPFQGLDDFRGTLVHSSEYRGGSVRRGSRTVVIGACNSGHDIAQDLHVHGAEVTLVQRSSTYVMTSENGIPVLFDGLFDEHGPPTEEADLLAASLPWLLALEVSKEQTATIAEKDRALLDGLERAGFKTDDGIDGAGLLSKALRRGGGYYIDVGCSRLIVDGKVKVKHGVAVERFTETGILFVDGIHLDADVVVLATGYANMRETARRLLGDAVADRCAPVWGLDGEGELRTVWRSSGHDGLWFMAGNLQMCRSYSAYLALRIKALEEGLIA